MFRCTFKQEKRKKRPNPTNLKRCKYWLCSIKNIGYKMYANNIG